MDGATRAASAKADRVDARPLARMAAALHLRVKPARTPQETQRAELVHGRDA